MLTDYAKSYLLKAPSESDSSFGPVWKLLNDNNAWEGWDFEPKPVFVHCPIDDVVPYANAYVAALELGMDPNNPDVIHQVAPIPLIYAVMGNFHIAAYPPAMLEAFRIIRTP
jgi:hypothetical protein